MALVAEQALHRGCVTSCCHVQHPGSEQSATHRQAGGCGNFSHSPHLFAACLPFSLGLAVREMWKVTV